MSPRKIKIESEQCIVNFGTNVVKPKDGRKGFQVEGESISVATTDLCRSITAADKAKANEIMFEGRYNGGMYEFAVSLTDADRAKLKSEVKRIVSAVLLEYLLMRDDSEGDARNLVSRL